MKGIFLSIILLLASCSTTPQQSTTEPEEQQQSSKITLLMPLQETEQQYFDTIHFGRMQEGEKIMGSFVIKNQSDKPLVITSIVPGCGCTNVNYDFKPIMPHDQRSVEFTFDSRGRVGVQLKAIDLITSDNKQSRILFDAEVVDSK